MADPEKLYMQTPLVLWIETFKANDGHPLEYRDLYDGVFINDVMQQIDPRPAYDAVNRDVTDVSVRLNNWEVLVRNVRGFYSDVLQQLLTMRLPNIGQICREPGKDQSFAELRRSLLLVLGCAVQCEQKEAFIDRIMAMDIEAQTEIVENIKEVTDDYETILPFARPQSPNSCSLYVEKTLHHLHKLIKERDQCAELASDLGQERDFYMSQAEGRPLVETQQLSPDKHHLALELAEVKAKLRHVRQELEDRQEQLSDTREELQETAGMCSQLKTENASLLHEARNTRSLKDEIDILKEKSSKVDMYENEILKYKERLNELEFYKARTEELKEDNSILEETKAMLEDQLTNSRKRVETVVELEAELGRYRQQVDQFTKDRAADRDKIDFLTSENARLEFEKKSSINESTSLESELSAARSRIGNMGSSLSEQLSETSHARVLRLELENQRLASKLAEMKESALIANAEVSLELEKENQRLVKKVEKFQTSACQASEQVIHMEGEISSVREDKDRLMKALDAVKDNAERQVRELERENEQLSQALDNIRERSEKTSDVRVKDLERENKRLHDTVSLRNSELNKMEFEQRQLQRVQSQLEGHSERSRELQLENQELEKQNSDLHQRVATLQHCEEKVEALEQENSDMGVENRKLQKTVESLQVASQRKDQLEQEHITLSMEHQRLQRSVEGLRVESERALTLEADKVELEQKLTTLGKQLEGQKVQKLKQEQTEFENIDLANEKQRLTKNLEVTQRRVQQLEKDNNDIEVEAERVAKEAELLRVKVARLEGREKEAVVMETEVQKLTKDKAAIEKENRKLKQSAELKDSSLEEINAKFQALDRESKSLRQSVDKMKETCAKVRDVERDNKELLESLNTDRRTLAALREELVGEKINSQELSNQLEQLRGELECVGIDTQRLAVAQQTNDAERYAVLESMIEETLARGREIKEEKIRALEVRLEESKGRNSRLQEQLRQSQGECEVLKQRYEEETIISHAPITFSHQTPNQSQSSSDSSARGVLELKDHLVELERNNATLMAEVDNLRATARQSSTQCHKLEGQVSNLTAQTATVQAQYSALRETHAKLQVEHSTVTSQATSTLTLQEELKHQLGRLETERDNLAHQHDELAGSHRSLVTDHESLTSLHNQLTGEYEAVVGEVASLKSLNKSLKSELREAQDQLNAFLQGKDDMNKLRDLLESERQQLKREVQKLGHLQEDYDRLHGDHQHMQAAYDKLSNDFSEVLSSHKQVKTDYNSLQLKSTEQQGELNDTLQNLSVAEVEFQKLENKMETVYQINERLECENQALLLQIQQLLNQNQELLTQALNSKDHFAVEEKAYLERLSELRRQKERLEEKIMEHYKNRISPAKKKGFGALLARKARGIISRNPKRSKSRNDLDNLDNSSHGSNEHTGDASRLELEARVNTSAKSTEDVREAGQGDTGGLLPGLGRPYNMDEADSGASTPGLVRKPRGRTSPGSEMLTLDQFLKEANKEKERSRSSSNTEPPATATASLETPPNPAAHRRRSNDRESLSSENSNTSSGKQQLPAHLRHNTSGNTSLSHFRPDSAPDGASSSFGSPASVHETNASRLSRNSSATVHDSFGSSIDVFSSTPKLEDSNSSLAFNSNFNNNTFSTPPTHARDFPDERQKRLSGEDWKNGNPEFSFSERVAKFGNQVNSNSNSNNDSKIHKQMYNQQQSVNLNSNNNNNNSRNNNRDLPPVPSDPPPPIPATERLDRLTMLASGDNVSHYASPHDLSLQGKTSHSPRVGSEYSQIQRRKSQGAADRMQGLPNQFQPPVPRSQPGSAGLNTSTGASDSLDNSVVSGHNPRRPPANSMSFQNNPAARPRPASVMGSSSSPHVRGVISRPPGEGRSRPGQGRPPGPPARRQSGAGERPAGHESVGPPHRAPLYERPKSVPPQLFNQSTDPGGGASTREGSGPPPRRREDGERGSGRDDGAPAVVLLREPTRPGSRLGQNSSTDPPGQPYPQHGSAFSGNSTNHNSAFQSHPANQRQGNHTSGPASQRPAHQPPPRPVSHSQPSTNHSSPYQTTQSGVVNQRPPSAGPIHPSPRDSRYGRQNDIGNHSAPPRPSVMGQSSRPDTLPFSSSPRDSAGQSREPAGHSAGHPPYHTSHSALGIGSRNPQESGAPGGMARSHSSMGQSSGNPGHPAGRPNTSGHPARRDANQDMNRPIRRDSSRPRDSAAGMNGDYARSQGRANSEPRDPPPVAPPRDSGYSHTAGMSPGQGHSSTQGHSPGQGHSPAHHPSGPGYSPGGDQRNNYHSPPGSYQQSAPLRSSTPSSNGPAHPPYPRSNPPAQPQSESVPPQIRSQGKPPGPMVNSVNSHHYGQTQPGKLAGGHPSTRDLRDPTSPDRPPAGPPVLPNPSAGPMKSPGQSGPAGPTAGQNGPESEGEEAQKKRNSIWYEYGCV